MKFNLVCYFSVVRMPGAFSSGAGRQEWTEITDEDVGPRKDDVAKEFELPGKILVVAATRNIRKRKRSAKPLLLLT